MIDKDQPKGKENNGGLATFPKPNTKLLEESVEAGFALSAVHRLITTPQLPMTILK